MNQIVAICTLYKALNARLNGGTGLHINIGVDYLECNEKAIENLLKIWGECEELFFKIANPEGEGNKSRCTYYGNTNKRKYSKLF